MTIENNRNINIAQTHHFQQKIPQQKNVCSVTKIPQCFEVRKDESSTESNYLKKIIAHVLPKLDSPIRVQIVKFMESKDGRVISNDEFERLKIKFRSHPNGSSWLAELKQSVAERNQEIRNAGVCRVVCHMIAVWLKQSLTGQAERLIFQIANENLPLRKPSKGITSTDYYLPIVEKDKAIQIDEKCFAKYLKTQEFQIQEKMPESRPVATEKILQEPSELIYPIENNSDFFMVDAEQSNEEIVACRFLREAEERRIKKEKAKKKNSIAVIDEPLVKNRLILDEGEYEGDSKNGLPHGMGRLEGSNGDVFEGEFKKGKFIKGKHIKASGTILEGEFVDNLLQGWGTLTANGKVTKGGFIYGNLDFKSITQ